MAGVLGEVRGILVRLEGVLAGVGLVEDEAAGNVDASAGLGQQASGFGAAGGGVPGLAPLPRSRRQRSSPVVSDDREHGSPFPPGGMICG
jgi:hypothetical protein